MKVIPEKSDFFLTINSIKEFELKIKGSRFISKAFPVVSKEEAEFFLAELRKQHYNATHNCFAYLIGTDNNNFRYSDDGEPSGTAGKQIFQAINHFDFKNILVGVTRYFGGTKLGVGPLARAYYEASHEVLLLCEPKYVYFTDEFEILSDYQLITLLKQLFEDYSLELEEEYSDEVRFKTKILKSASDIFQKKIIDKTNGKVHIKKL